MHVPASQGRCVEVKGQLVGGHLFSPSTMWILGIELGSSGLASKRFGC